MTAQTTSEQVIEVEGVGDVELHITRHGAGRPVLLLHGGGGPQTVGRFAERLAGAADVEVLVPVHPGFAATPRPTTLSSINDLARLYRALLERLELVDVTVIGNSIGGWIAAELGLLRTDRLRAIVLVDAVGIEVAGHPAIDFFTLTLDDVARLAYHDPEKFRIDPAAMSPAERGLMLANREALAIYGGNPSAMDPTLSSRLEQLRTATLVIWGDSDQIVDPVYGKAYADAIPGARFELLASTGHLPQLESPTLLTDSVLAFIAEPASSGTRPN